MLSVTANSTPTRQLSSCWIKEHPDLHASQVLDWLKERYNDYAHSERNVRRYVADLREEHKIEKRPPHETTRQFRNCPPANSCKWILASLGLIERAAGPLSSM